MLIPTLLACTLYAQAPLAPELRLARILARVRAMPPESRLRALSLLEDLMAHAGPELKPQLEPVIAEIRTLAQPPSSPASHTRPQQPPANGLTESQQAILRQRVERVRALSPEGRKRVLAFLDSEIPRSQAPIKAILEALRAEISPTLEP